MPLVVRSGALRLAHRPIVDPRGVTEDHPGRVIPAHPDRRDIVRVVPDVDYEIRIRGKVGDPLLASFGEFSASIRPAETILRGAVQDQAALHGLLDRIQSLGLELIELRQVDELGDTGRGRS